MMRGFPRLTVYDSKMRKLLDCLIPALTAVAAANLAGCAGKDKPDEYQTSRLENLPFVYRMTVQQGNILNEDNVDQLQPGMTKRQVQYLLGTPLLTDFFNTDRWDYVYTIQRGHQSMESRKLTVMFQDDALVRVEGDLKPNPQRAAARERKEIVVSVPDYEKRKGLIGRSLEAVGVDTK
jgi:outer membrane protein assembly factor BamE